MKQILGTALSVLMVTLGVVGIGQAQSSLPASGTIEAVNCQTDVLIMNLDGLVGIESGIELFGVAPYATVFINSSPATFCTLSQYVGSYAIASAAPEGGPRTVGRIDVLIPPPTYNPYSVGHTY